MDSDTKLIITCEKCKQDFMKTINCLYYTYNSCEHRRKLFIDATCPNCGRYLGEELVIP